MDLRAISPLDGRYAEKTANLRSCLSEWALLKYRVLVEVRWLIAMSEDEDITHVRKFSDSETMFLNSLTCEFDDDAVRRIKAIETETNHDVKAVEYYIRERLQETSLQDMLGSVHFACTSDDINNLAYAMMFRDAMRDIYGSHKRGRFCNASARWRRTLRMCPCWRGLMVKQLPRPRWVRRLPFSYTGCGASLS